MATSFEDLSPMSSRSGLKTLTLTMAMAAVVDAAFGEPRLADIYDALDLDRSDLDAYLAMADEFAARDVLDVGCGTGTFACLLAERGINVVGLDPAAASLEVARRKPGADRVRWVLGDWRALPPLQVDMVTMTGNVAQIFLDETEWLGVLEAARAALRADGRLIFETARSDRARVAGLDPCEDRAPCRHPRRGRRTHLVRARGRPAAARLVSWHLPVRDRRHGDGLGLDAAVPGPGGADGSAQRYRVCRGGDPRRRGPAWPADGIRCATVERVRVRQAADAVTEPLESARSDVHRIGDVVVRASGEWSPSGPLRRLAGPEPSPSRVGARRSLPLDTTLGLPGRSGCSLNRIIPAASARLSLVMVWTMRKETSPSWTELHGRRLSLALGNFNDPNWPKATARVRPCRKQCAT